MPDFRVYCWDGDGHIGFADWVEARDVNEAMTTFRSIKPDAKRCEVWLKDQLVAKLNEDGRMELLSD